MVHLIRELRSTLLQAALFFGLWVLCSAKAQRADLLAGALSAVLAVLASRIVARHGLGRLLPRPRWILECWHLPWMVATGMVDIFGVLARQIFAHKAAASVVSSVSFDAAVTLRGDVPRRLVGLEMTGVIESLLLMTLAAATGSPSFLDAGLALALLAFGGGLVFVRFLERPPGAACGPGIAMS